MSVRLKAGEFAFEEAAANAEAIDRNSIAKKFFNGVLVGIAIGFAVFAVGDEEDDFSAGCGPRLWGRRCLLDPRRTGLEGFFATDRGRARVWVHAAPGGAPGIYVWGEQGR